MTTCYFQLGDVADNYRPCGNDNGQTRHCCSKPHYCLSNGLCMVPDDLSIYRGACSSQKWDNDACTNICLKYSTHSGVWRCNGDQDGSGKQQWACDLSGCGNSSQMFTVDTGNIQRNEKLSSAINIEAVATTTVEVTAATTTGSCIATGDTSPTAEAAQQTNGAANASSCEPGISTGAAVGIGVGPAIPLLLALGLMSWLFWRERKRTRSKATSATGGYHNPNEQYGGYYNDQAPKPGNPQVGNMSELGADSQHTAAELDGSTRR